MVRYPVVHDLTVVLELQCQNTSLGSASRDELFRESSHEFVRVLLETTRETINPKVYSSLSLDARIITEDAYVRPRSQTRDLVDQSHIVSLNEDQIRLHLK